MKCILIAALGENREIGRNNDLMWHLPADMRFFRDTTTGHPVIMGRKNWDSIPEKYRPLANRENIVLTQQTGFQSDGAHVFHQLKEAVAHCAQKGEALCFIIGGAQIYALALAEGYADEMYLTHVHAAFPDAHAFFPEYHHISWKKDLLSRHDADEKHQYAFDIWHYTKA